MMLPNTLGSSTADQRTTTSATPVCRSLPPLIEVGNDYSSERDTETQERAASLQGQGSSISGDPYSLSGSCGVEPWVALGLLPGGTLIYTED